MECNKEEAIRAKDLAEKKMQTSDFIGARKIAVKAQQLYPELENISQLLTVCEIHCSAQNKLNGSEMNWYGILQIERTTDDVSIKKQYRKLALLLHPDKNKFPGAEAAFKLIGEANRVLSDKDKRCMYDMKCRVPARSAVASKVPPHQVPKNNFVRKQYSSPPNNYQNAPNPNFNGMNSHQQSQSLTFWTSCPYCNTKYQYYQNILAKNLRCQNCLKPFVAHDMGPQGAVPSSSSFKQPVFMNQKGMPTPNSSSVNQPFTSKPMGGPTGPATKAGISTRVHVGSTKSKGKEEDQNVGVGSRKAKDRPAAKTTSRKRGRNTRVESSESLDTSSSDDTEEDVVNGYADAGSPVGDRRRSSRKKQRVTYNERLSDDDDDFVSPPIRSQGVGTSSAAVEPEVKQGATGDSAEEEMKQKTSEHDKDTLPNRGKKVEDNGKTEVKDDSELELDSEPVETYEYPDPDFSDFDKDKEEQCFDVDQVWAIYDQVDGMPRFYAQVKKVHLPHFKLQIRWLEAKPDEPDEMKWAEEGLPVSCGKFKCGEYQEFSDRLLFSHKVSFYKGKSRGTFMIHPRKGETWALFKDWDIKWSSDPENHKAYKFEFVEILSDYSQRNGVEVAYLCKVKGFVSLFKQIKLNGISSFQLPTNELFKFSHQIPSYRMTGEEQEGVPKDSLELDPVSLPRDLDDYYDPNEVNMDNDSKMDSEMNNSPKNPEKIDLEKVNLTPRRSSRESNPLQEEAEIRSNHVNEKLNTPKKHGKNHIDLSDSEETSGQADEETVQGSGKFQMVPEANFYDFKDSKSVEKLVIGQVWALYSVKNNKLPIKYVQIKRKHSSANVLSVIVLEPVSPPEGQDTSFSISCGVFKLSGLQAVKLETFSHLVNADRNDDGTLEIYPKTGQVWAMYKNWKPKPTGSGPGPGPVVLDQGYTIVEIVEENEVCFKVSVLQSVNGLKWIYKTPRRQRSQNGVDEVVRSDLSRFSTRIPAYRHTGEKDARLRDCWQLDPASIPGTTIYLD